MLVEDDRHLAKAEALFCGFRCCKGEVWETGDLGDLGDLRSPRRPPIPSPHLGPPLPPLSAERRRGEEVYELKMGRNFNNSQQGRSDKMIEDRVEMDERFQTRSKGDRNKGLTKNEKNNANLRYWT